MVEREPEPPQPTGESAGQLWQAAAIWALLTLAILALLGFGLPVLIAGTFAELFPAQSLLIGAGVGLVVTAAGATLLLAATRRRYGGQPRLLRALTLGYAVALALGAPPLLLLLAAVIRRTLG